jgi:diguanylate cyclase (GGDEF)-like protein
METDLFEKEQQFYDNALNRVTKVREGAQFDIAEYAKITKEYGKLLKKLRRFAQLAGKVTTDAHEGNLDLNDKVQYDALTGIYNRRYIEDNLQRVIKSMVRSGGGLLSILMIDMDFFKKYNDTYGYGEGDDCLKSVAKVIAASVMRPDDFVGRYDGEEFVVILPNTNEKGACVMADKILEGVRTCGIPHKKNKAADCVTVSIGVTTANIDLPCDGDDYIKRADEALYMSKGSGRNKYTFLAIKEEVYEI